MSSFTILSIIAIVLVATVCGISNHEGITKVNAEESHVGQNADLKVESDLSQIHQKEKFTEYNRKKRHETEGVVLEIGIIGGGGGGGYGGYGGGGGGYGGYGGGGHRHHHHHHHHGGGGYGGYGGGGGGYGGYGGGGGGYGGYGGGGGGYGGYGGGGSYGGYGRR